MSTSSERSCSNCRAVLAADASSCPECGVYAGDLYDERVHRPKTRFVPFTILLLLAVVAAGAAIWWNMRGKHAPPSTPAVAAPPSVRVVGDRPGGARRLRGGKINEAEAMRLVRRHIVTTAGLQTDCVALLGDGLHRGGYVVIANNRCDNTRLGKWRVDVKSGEVTRAR